MSDDVKLLERTTLKNFNRWMKYTNDTIRIAGLDLGGVTTEKYRQGDFAVWHTTGHTGWSGVGETSYYPPTYYVVRASEHPEYHDLEFLYEVEANKSTWRECLRLCIQEVNKLSSQAVVNKL